MTKFHQYANFYSVLRSQTISRYDSFTFKNTLKSLKTFNYMNALDS